MGTVYGLVVTGAVGTALGGVTKHRIGYTRVWRDSQYLTLVHYSSDC